MANTKIYHEQGGDELVVSNGGTLTVESGGTLALASGATFTSGTNAIEAADLAAVASLSGLTASVEELNKLDGAGDVVASGTQASAISNLNESYGTGDLDSEAEIIAALNATNAAINDILAALRAFGIIAPTK